MAQLATLTTPVTQPTVSTYQIASVTAGRLPEWELSIVWLDNVGKLHSHWHRGVFHATTNPSGADVLVKQFNKLNLTTIPLEERAKIHLDTCTVGKGETPGPATMSGTAD